MKSPLAVWAGMTPSPFSPPANLLLKDKALSVVPTYGSQGLHGFLGMNNAQAGSARPQASNASEDFKVASSGSNSTASNANVTATSGATGAGGAGVAQAQRAPNQPTAIQAQQQGQQGQQQQGFGSYPY
ncbi:hypothetical protein AYX14_07150, partial [Cryptococcus neoformans]